MKVFLSIVTFIGLSSCAPTISIPDTLESVEKPLELILSYLQEDTIDSFQVEVINRFGGEYKVTSNIEKAPNGTSIKTHIVDASGIVSDTTLFFPNQEFNE